MTEEYTEPVGDWWSQEANSTFEDLKKSVLSDPCLCQFDHRKSTVLRTDFSCLGFGYVVCQPDDDDFSLEMTTQYMSGNGFGFMTKSGNQGTLHPVAFGSRRTQGNEKRLQSYLGEGFAGDWAINKVRHMCFGCRFVWVTDCYAYAVKFILSYDGANPAILRLQMRLMCWDANDFLVDTDYWSRLDADLCYDPTFHEYLQFVSSFHSTHPPPTDIPMQQWGKMPYYYYWGSRVKSPGDSRPPVNVAANSLLTMLVTQESNSPPCLANYPVQFGQCPMDQDTKNRALYNSEYPVLAFHASRFSWAVYSFNSGNFASTISKQNLPFDILLACDPICPWPRIIR